MKRRKRRATSSVSKKKKLKTPSEITEDPPEELPGGFGLLPDEMLENIIRYLPLDDIGRLGRVCKKFYHFTRRDTFWRKVDSPYLNANKIHELCAVLPPCTTHLKLKMDRPRQRSLESRPQPINLQRLFFSLRKRCPNLRVLQFDDAILQYFDEAVRFTRASRYACAHLPVSLRVLALRHSGFTAALPVNHVLDPFINSQIEVLDISRSHKIGVGCLTMASMLPQLKELRASIDVIKDCTLCAYSSFIRKLRVLDLEGSLISSDSIDRIWFFGRLLTELYLCFTLLKDSDVEFDPTSVPQLSVLCVRATHVTHRGIEELIRRCPSLTRLTASDCDCGDSAAVHQRSKDYVRAKVDYTTTNLFGYKYCDHFKSVDYLRDY